MQWPIIFSVRFSLAVWFLQVLPWKANQLSVTRHLQRRVWTEDQDIPVQWDGFNGFIAAKWQLSLRFPPR